MITLCSRRTLLLFSYEPSKLQLGRNVISYVNFFLSLLHTHSYSSLTVFHIRKRALYLIQLHILLLP
ncbi:unnamed protein product [Auanema sp. JU1783]|nr:unnamed protein product [Auanema sp. JU1783]